MIDQDWWIHLKETNYSFETFSIYADWLEDNGLHNKYRAVRLIVEKQYKPDVYDNYYVWWRSIWYERKINGVIPYEAFDNLNDLNKHGYSIYPASYDNMEEAYRDLTNAMIIYCNALDQINLDVEKL